MCVKERWGGKGYKLNVPNNNDICLHCFFCILAHINSKPQPQYALSAIFAFSSLDSLLLKYHILIMCIAMTSLLLNSATRNSFPLMVWWPVLVGETHLFIFFKLYLHKKQVLYVLKPSFLISLLCLPRKEKLRKYEEIPLGSISISSKTNKPWTYLT